MGDPQVLPAHLRGRDGANRGLREWLAHQPRDRPEGRLTDGAARQRSWRYTANPFGVRVEYVARSSSGTKFSAPRTPSATARPCVDASRCVMPPLSERTS